ncbi:DUF4190 domain-containing protein [Nonomuraea sp. NPDC049419]|uniref:DUF4190 domain-containing protein n=1 Tax=Nonomuraea sp. NPDC049419 TaxID=3155772 RepID=UPI00341545C2
MAAAALVFGILGLLGGWCLAGLPSIIAIILGHVAARQTKNGARSGHGVGVAGLVLGYVAVVPAIVVFIALFAIYPDQFAELINTTLGWLLSTIN